MEMFWDGVLVYAQVNRTITLNRLEQVTGTAHPMDWIFHPQTGYDHEPSDLRNFGMA